MRRIMRRPEVSSVTGLSRTRLDELERDGRFPQRVRISDRATGWWSDEIEEWITSRPRAADVDADMSGQLRATATGLDPVSRTVWDLMVKWSPWSRD